MDQPSLLRPVLLVILWLVPTAAAYPPLGSAWPGPVAQP
jgi:hypothetical protein